MKRLIAWPTMVAFLAGCATPQSQAVPDFRSHAEKLRKIGVVVDAQVEYLGFGDHRGFSVDDGKSAELSAQAVKSLEDAAMQELSARGYVVTVLPTGDDTRAFSGKYKWLRGNIDRPFDDADGKIAGVAPVPDAAQLAGQARVDGIVIVSAKDVATGPGVVLVAALGVFVFYAAAPVLYPLARADSADRPGFPGRGLTNETRYNADFAVFDNKGKIVFHERCSLRLTDEHSIGLASARFADDMMSARQ